MGSGIKSGSVFQVIGPATENARWPHVLSRKRGAASRWQLVECRCHCMSALETGMRYSYRYGGMCFSQVCCLSSVKALRGTQCIDFSQQNLPSVLSLLDPLTKCWRKMWNLWHKYIHYDKIQTWTQTPVVNTFYLIFIVIVVVQVAFSALTLSVGRKGEHPACKNWVMRCWCLERGANRLHKVQLMPLPSQIPIISCLIQI